ncbi:MAG: hypothetical protein K9L30_09340 [Desulfobacterales bacterium]|nr:hypothetical protein [Desulfobacterales bacterium]
MYFEKRIQKNTFFIIILAVMFTVFANINIVNSQELDYFNNDVAGIAERYEDVRIQQIDLEESSIYVLEKQISVKEFTEFLDSKGNIIAFNDFNRKQKVTVDVLLLPDDNIVAVKIQQVDKKKDAQKLKEIDSGSLKSFY